MQTFYLKTKDRGPTILLAQTAKGQIVGGFASESWHVSHGYYGNGEAFVFAFDEKFNKYYVNLVIRDSILGYLY